MKGFTEHTFILPGDDPRWPTQLPVKDVATGFKIVHRSGITFVYARPEAGVPFDSMFQRPSTKAEKLELLMVVGDRKRPVRASSVSRHVEPWRFKIP